MQTPLELLDQVRKSIENFDNIIFIGMNKNGIIETAWTNITSQDLALMLMAFDITVKKCIGELIEGTQNGGVFQ
jgi:hypothetical protein